MPRICRNAFAAVALAAVMAIGATAPAQAVLIDFEGLSNGDQGTNVIAFPDVTFTVGGGGSAFIQPNPTRNLCAFSPVFFDCTAPLTVSFTSAVSNLSFQTLFAANGDEITVDVFDNATPLGSVVVTTDTTVDLSAFSNVTALEILYTGSASGGGMGYDNFSFDVGGGILPSAPEPAALALFGLGLAGLGLMRRRHAS